MTTKRKWLTVLVAIAALLLVVRLLLPSVLLHIVNEQGRKMGDYRVQVEDIDLHLWRGAYSLHGMVVEKSSGRVPVPLATIPTLELSVSWRALLQGAVVARVHFVEPELRLVDGRGAADSQSGAGVDWRAQLERLLPLRLDELRISRGRLHFQNFITRPQVDLSATDIEARVENLTNVREDRQKRAAHLEASARVLGGAPLSLDMRFDPLRDLRDFGLDLRVQKLQLPALNDFLRAYAYLDVSSGAGEVVLQLEAREGRLKGYLKPLFRDIKLVDWEKDTANPLRLAWEMIAGTLVTLFKNQPRDQFATRIELAGSVENPDLSAWQAILGVLRNAFIEALVPGYDRAHAAAENAKIAE